MTTTRALANLFRAIGAADLSRATTLASRLCDLEEEKGHRSAARLLRGALGAKNSAQHGSLSAPHISESHSAFSTALVRSTDTRSLEEVMLSDSIVSELENLILEWTHRDQLKALGIGTRSKLLFHGPPGCGKSLTAQVLGNALNLPVYIVRFDAVIGAFLGQTAIHLRQIFHFAETNPCVLLLDELDALGKKRGSPLDVGELDRIVISLLQELEHSRPQGFVIATTNLASHLDDALWRRFDLELKFRAPTRGMLNKFARHIAAQKKVDLRKEVLTRAMSANSFASAEKTIISEIRKNVLVSLSAEK
jgi:SpoVK/Ycf46/Vps4 family AAA+-type ATPase